MILILIEFYTKLNLDLWSKFGSGLFFNQWVFLCVLTVYDAFGKMGSNVEGGNINQPGLLQQCRSTVGPSFSGQYCQVFLKQVNTKKKNNKFKMPSVR